VRNDKEDVSKVVTLPLANACEDLSNDMS